MSSLTARSPPTSVQARREAYLEAKGADPAALLPAIQQSTRPVVRGSDDSGFDESPIVDQNYTPASGLSIVRRK